MKRVLAIDWGTHSSKWCYQDSDGRIIVGQIWDSAVWREGEGLMMCAMGRRHRGDRGESALKRKLIQDPDQAFWEGPRPKLGATLGEATVFSLLGLISDARAALGRKGVSIKNDEGLTIRFSHPNWISPDKVSALSYYRDAGVIAACAYQNQSLGMLGEDSFQLRLCEIQDVVRDHQVRTRALRRLPAVYDYDAYTACLKGEMGNVSWELVFESCAAGFPYLVEADAQLFDTAALARSAP